VTVDYNALVRNNGRLITAYSTIAELSAWLESFISKASTAALSTNKEQLDQELVAVVAALEKAKSQVDDK
jgi:hypothetical protein